MRIAKLYYYLSYFPMTFLESEKRNYYKFKIFSVLLDIERKGKAKAYSRYFLQMRLKAIDTELGLFIKTYNKTFSTEEKKFFKTFWDLTRHIKRYVWYTNSKAFPAAYIDLTTEGLSTFASWYKKEYALKRNNEILAIENEYYLKLAETIAEKAEETLEEELKNYDNKIVL